MVIAIIISHTKQSHFQVVFWNSYTILSYKTHHIPSWLILFSRKENSSKIVQKHFAVLPKCKMFFILSLTTQNYTLYYLMPVKPLIESNFLNHSTFCLIDYETTLMFASLFTRVSSFPCFPKNRETGKWEAQNREITVLVSDYKSQSELFIKKYPNIFYILKELHTNSLTSRNNLCIRILFICPN